MRELIQSRKVSVRKQREAKKLLQHFHKGLAAQRDSYKTAVQLQQAVQQVAEAVQTTAHSKVSAVVTKALQTVFGSKYSFNIEFVRKRGKTEAVLSFRKGKLEIDPMQGSGGGIVDVAAFALRISAILLQKPARRRFLCLDEPFKFVSDRGEYRQRVRQLVLSLAEELDFQFVMVTHDRNLEVGKTITLYED